MSGGSFIKTGVGADRARIFPFHRFETNSCRCSFRWHALFINMFCSRLVCMFRGKESSTACSAPTTQRSQQQPTRQTLLGRCGRTLYSTWPGSVPCSSWRQSFGRLSEASARTHRTQSSRSVRSRHGAHLEADMAPSCTRRLPGPARSHAAFYVARVSRMQLVAAVTSEPVGRHQSTRMTRV